MKIAPIAAPAPSAGSMPVQVPASLPMSGMPARPQSHIVEVKRGETYHPTGAESPASQFYMKYGHTLLTMPGAYSVGWGYKEDEVYLWMESEAGAALLKGLVEPVVNGIKVIIGIHETGQPYDGPENDNASERARAIAALPGVWDYQHRGTDAWGQILVKTINQQVVDTLDPLIKDRYTWGYSRGGQQRWMRVLWKPGVPAS